MQYETKLEELRRLRKDSKALKGKKGLAEHAIVKRIHFIYERAHTKVQGGPPPLVCLAGVVQRDWQQAQAFPGAYFRGKALGTDAKVPCRPASMTSPQLQ